MKTSNIFINLEKYLTHIFVLFNHSIIASVCLHYNQTIVNRPIIEDFLSKSLSMKSSYWLEVLINQIEIYKIFFDQWETLTH